MTKNKDAAKKARQTAKAQSESLNYQTYWGAKKAYPELDAATDERLRQELAWIDNCHFTHGFLQLKEILDLIRSKFHSEVGPTRGFLAGSAVAYCLGLSDSDPIPENRIPEEMLQPATPVILNVEFRLDPEVRNPAVTVAEEKFGKSMMRNSIPIIKLDRIILEFQRDLSRLKRE